MPPPSSSDPPPNPAETDRPSTAVSRPMPAPDGSPATIDTEDPLARAAVAAIRAGDVEAMRRLLQEHPGLATTRLGNPPEGCDPGMTRSLLHVVTDWPGHYPNGAAMVALLVGAGADVNARFTGPHTETPLHWAASSDDVDVLDALLDAGADIEAPGAVIAGGAPLSDAVAFGQWQAARRLVERGARTPFREAAALGLLERIERYFGGNDAPTPDEITQAFWYACHGGQRSVAEHLLDRGADINWISTWDNLTPLDAARRSAADDVVSWLQTRGGKSAGEKKG
jgi:ankyrin repeat protein